MDRVGVEGIVDEGDAGRHDAVELRLIGARRGQPGGGLLRRSERLEGADRRRPGDRDLWRRRSCLGVTRATAPPAGAGRGGDRLDDQDAVAVLRLAACQVAAVGERQRAGEVELRESEERAQRGILSVRAGSRQADAA
jgi:hypothetical protein